MLTKKSSGFQTYPQNDQPNNMKIYFSIMQGHLDMIFREFVDGLLSETCLMDDDSNEISAAKLREIFGDHFK